MAMAPSRSFQGLDTAADCALVMFACIEDTHTLRRTYSAENIEKNWQHIIDQNMRDAEFAEARLLLMLAADRSATLKSLLMSEHKEIREIGLLLMGDPLA